MTESAARQISIAVKTVFLESESDPQQLRFVFADANGKVQEVQGDGVVGEQPYLQPGEGFEYTSGTKLETSMGTMGGSYLMQTDDGEQFKAPIDEFLLSGPRTLH